MSNSVFDEILDELRSSDAYDAKLAERASAELAALEAKAENFKADALKYDELFHEWQSKCLERDITIAKLRDAIVNMSNLLTHAVVDAKPETFEEEVRAAILRAMREYMHPALSSQKRDNS